MKRFIVISTLIIVAGLGVLFLALKTPEPLPGCGVKDFDNFCGTQAFYNEGSVEGKQIFNANCASCHKLDRKMTGPALRGVYKKYDSITILKFLHGEQTIIVNEDYENTCIIFPQLTNEDIMHILAYTN